MSLLSISLIEGLLYENEGNALDFKREQYKFEGASREDKSELLKDILAFANSWRRTAAYIIVGVDENKGGRGKIVGVAESLDDAKLQQFVNSKTNKPVTFAYRVFSIESKLIGVIAIPAHERPIYLTSDFGKLEKEKVYVRRGSSTAIATPDEIVRMGLESSDLSPPNLCLQWADLDDRRCLPSPCALEGLILEPRLPEGTFDRTRENAGYSFLRSYTNLDYSKELIEYTYSCNLLRKLGFRLHNESDYVARRVRFIGRVTNQPNSKVLDWEDRPQQPYRDTLLGLTRDIRPIAEQLRRDPDPSVQAYKGYTEIIVDFGDIRPHDEIWSTTPILLGALEERTIVVDGELRGDNLVSPIPCRLEAKLTVQVRPMGYEDVQRGLESED